MIASLTTAGGKSSVWRTSWGLAWEISQFWQFRQRKLQPVVAIVNALVRGL